MEWSAATAEATQAFGLVIEVTKGHEHGVRKHEHGVRKHEQGVRKHVRFNIGIQLYKVYLYVYNMLCV